MTPPEPPKPSVFDALKDVAKFADQVDAEIPKLDNPEHRELMSRITREIRFAHGKAELLFPEAHEVLKTIGEEGLARAEKLQTDLAGVGAELAKRTAEAKAKAAAAKPAAPPPAADLPPLDPGFGAALRDELLSTLFPAAAGVPFDPGQDIWQDWK